LQERKNAQQRAELMQMQMDQQKRQQEQQARAQQQQDEFRAMIQSPLSQANIVAAQAGPLGTRAAAAAQPAVDPQAQLMFSAMKKGQLSPLDYLKLQQKDETPLIVPEGGTAITRSGRVIASGTPKREPTDKDLELLKLLHGEGTPAYMAAMQQLATKRSTHAPAPSASVIMKQEGEEAKVVGKGYGEQYLKLQESGMAAQKAIARADQFAALLDGVNTGKLTPVGTEIAAVAQSLGMNIDPKLGNKQAAEALSNQMALELRNPAGGAGMPGAMSDEDRSFLKNMTANLGKTPEANAMILDATRKVAKRDQEVAAMARTYRAKRGSLDEGFYNELDAFSKANPLFQSAAAPGKLNPAEQAELAALRARLRGQ